MNNAICDKCFIDNDCEMCAFRNPKGAATAIIIRDNKILLLKRNEEPFKGMLDLPGGYMNEGEVPEITISRELREELGVEIKELNFMAMESGLAYWKGKNFPVISHFYLVDIGEQEIVLNTENSEYIWMPLKDIEPGSIAFDTNQAIARRLKAEYVWDLGRVKELIKQLDPTAEVKEQALYKAIINGYVSREYDESGKLVGFGWIFPRQTALRRTAVVEDMIVSEDQRGKGLGKKILLDLLEWAKEQGVEVVELTTGHHRIAAGELYKSVGFVLHDTRHMLYKI